MHNESTAVVLNGTVEVVSILRVSAGTEVDELFQQDCGLPWVGGRRVSPIVRTVSAVLGTTLLVGSALAASPTDTGPIRLAQAEASSTAAPTVDKPSSGDTTQLEEVTVTGSRIARDNYNAPTPVNVVSADDLHAAAPSNIADFVSSLPALRGGSNSATGSTSVSSGSAGIASMNLRSLGSQRTLVLLDGQRSVTSSSDGRVDVNTFPQSLIERVEVVTGGASAAYGSDAVGGVVNFILNKTFTGIKSDLEYGETARGDNADKRATVTIGVPFAEGRGHALLSGEYFTQDGVHTSGREWNERSTFAMQNPAALVAAGQPYYVVAPNVGVAIRTPGGLITSGPLQGTYFGPNGTVNQFAYGDPVQGQMMQGGDYLYSLTGMNGGNSLAPDEDRRNIFGRVSIELFPGTEVFAQAAYAKHENLSYYIQPTQGGIAIMGDNAYIPSALRQRMTDLGLPALPGQPAFMMGSSNIDFPRAGSNNERETQRYVVGANGDFNAFGKKVKWDGYYQYGRTKTHELTTQIWNNARLALATDAVEDPVTGGIVCRSTLTDPGNGCVPLNRFGVGVADPAAIDWIFDRPLREQEFVQEVAAVNFSTNDIDGWAGPISFATGVENRRERMDGTVDPRFESGWKLGNFLASTGKYDVTEGYVETVIPIASGLDFNGAGRYTHYSTSGNAQTWKLGLTYQPIEDVKLRMSRSRDIRAPNMAEMFSAGTSRSNSVPINGVPVPIVQTLRGNVDLQPEVADAIGVGIVFTPRFLPGFAMSVDYYDIDVKDVITTLSAEQTVELCMLNNVQKFCDNLGFNNGVLQSIDLFYENFNRLTTKGLDVEAAYQFGLGAGSMELRAMATHYIENVTDNGTTKIDIAGVNSAEVPSVGATPDWVYRLSALYKLDPWTFNLTLRGVSAGVLGNYYVECSSNCPTVTAPYFTINDNHVAGANYLDASISRTFDMSAGKLQAFFSIRNILDKDPALAVMPAGVAGEHVTQFPQTNRQLYDLMGRAFRLGVRLNF